jgi:hypothetical protein
VVIAVTIAPAKRCRQTGQNTPDEIAARNLDVELDQKEKHSRQRTTELPADRPLTSHELRQVGLPSAPAITSANDLHANPADADEASSSSAADSDASNNDEADEEAELMRELEKIKKVGVVIGIDPLTSLSRSGRRNLSAGPGKTRSAPRGRWRPPTRCWRLRAAGATSA